MNHRLFFFIVFFSNAISAQNLKPEIHIQTVEDIHVYLKNDPSLLTSSEFLKKIESANLPTRLFEDFLLSLDFKENQFNSLAQIYLEKVFKINTNIQTIIEEVDLLPLTREDDVDRTWRIDENIKKQSIVWRKIYSDLLLNKITHEEFLNYFFSNQGFHFRKKHTTDAYSPIHGLGSHGDVIAEILKKDQILSHYIPDDLINSEIYFLKLGKYLSDGSYVIPLELIKKMDNHSRLTNLLNNLTNKKPIDKTFAYLLSGFIEKLSKENKIISGTELNSQLLAFVQNSEIKGYAFYTLLSLSKENKVELSFVNNIFSDYIEKLDADQLNVDYYNDVLDPILRMKDSEVNNQLIRKMITLNYPKEGIHSVLNIKDLYRSKYLSSWLDLYFEQPGLNLEKSLQIIKDLNFYNYSDTVKWAQKIFNTYSNDLSLSQIEKYFSSSEIKQALGVPSVIENQSAVALYLKTKIMCNKLFMK